MQELFRGHVVIDWKGTTLNTTKCKKLNQIIVRKCVEFHVKWWQERNEERHNDDEQRNRLMKWYEKIKLKAENSNQRQMRLCVKKNEIKVQQCRTETIKRWTCNVKEFEKKIDKIPQNDIRRYFEV